MLRLKEIRAGKNVMQRELAQRLNKTRACISQWERNVTEPDLQSLIQIADILGVTTDELLGRAELVDKRTCLLTNFGEIAMTSFGEKLREYRTKRHLSQSALAKEIGFSQSVLCDWENGKVEPTASAIVSVANYFGVSTDTLLGCKNLVVGNIEEVGVQPPNEQLLVNLYRTLSICDRAELIGFAKGLAY